MEQPRSTVDAGAPGRGRHPIVACIRWPVNEAERQRLAFDARPRLLLVEAGAAPPDVVDELEDWVFADSGDDDVLRRVANLEARARPRAGKGAWSSGRQR